MHHTPKCGLRTTDTRSSVTTIDCDAPFGVRTYSPRPLPMHVADMTGYEPSLFSVPHLAISKGVVVDHTLPLSTRVHCFPLRQAVVVNGSTPFPSEASASTANLAVDAPALGKVSEVLLLLQSTHTIGTPFTVIDPLHASVPPGCSFCTATRSTPRLLMTTAPSRQGKLSRSRAPAPTPVPATRTWLGLG